MSKFCNGIGCEGHERPLRYVSAEFPKSFYYIFKRQEFGEWFLCNCRKNRLICSYCEDCNTCSRFHFVKQEIHKLGILLGVIGLDSQFCGKSIKNIF